MKCIDKNIQGMKERGKEIERIKFRINEIENSEEMSLHKQLVEKRSKLSLELDFLSSVLTSKFSSLEKSLKKFRKITQERREKFELTKELDNYIDHPLDILVDDVDFRFLYSILERMEGLIKNGMIELEEKKKEKTLEVIEDLKLS